MEQVSLSQDCATTAPNTGKRKSQPQTDYFSQALSEHGNIEPTSIPSIDSPDSQLLLDMSHERGTLPRVSSGLPEAPTPQVER